MEQQQPPKQSALTSQLLKMFAPQDLYGKSIKDKRGGPNNIHSWDLELKGPILNQILTARRKKQWVEEFGIKWMDGMPLTLQQIQTFAAHENLQAELDDLVAKGYLTLEHPKQLVNGKRIQSLGYNIVTSKLSFEINKILEPHQVVPTLVAMDMQGIFVVDNGGLRNLTLTECLRLFGYPHNYKLNVIQRQGFDLLGPTVVVPVIKHVAKNYWKPISTMSNTL